MFLFFPKKAIVEQDGRGSGEGGIGHRQLGVCLCCGLAGNPLLSGQGREGERDGEKKKK